MPATTIPPVIVNTSFLKPGEITTWAISTPAKIRKDPREPVKRIANPETIYAAMAKAMDTTFDRSVIMYAKTTAAKMQTAMPASFGLINEPLARDKFRI